MTVILTNEQDALPVDEDAFREQVERVAAEAGFPGELGVALVTDAAIHELNRRHLDHDEPTDVLAFPYPEGDAEIVVSAERARDEARARDVDPQAELLLYVIHGLLHLTGYDDHEESAARDMHRESLRLLARLGHRNSIES